MKQLYFLLSLTLISSSPLTISCMEKSPQYINPDYSNAPWQLLMTREYTCEDLLTKCKSNKHKTEKQMQLLLFQASCLFAQEILKKITDLSEKYRNVFFDKNTFSLVLKNISLYILPLNQKLRFIRETCLKSIDLSISNTLKNCILQNSIKYAEVLSDQPSNFNEYIEKIRLFNCQSVDQLYKILFPDGHRN